MQNSQKFTPSMIKKLLCSILLFLPISATLAANLFVNSNGTATFNHKIYRCALGKNGVTGFKAEGDLKTPLGKFSLRYVYYRPDRFPKGIHTGLRQRPLSPNIGWCDDPTSSSYNQPVKLPFLKSHEVLWRSDDIYDLIIVVGYNDQAICKGKGSAIFIHVARENYSPTAGCVVFSKKDLVEILEGLSPRSLAIIQY